MTLVRGTHQETPYGRDLREVGAPDVTRQQATGLAHAEVDSTAFSICRRSLSLTWSR
jgi:hypothetical protein